MRKIQLPNILLAPRHALKPGPHASPFGPLFLRPTSLTPCRSLAQVRSDREVFPETWFSSSSPPRHAPEEFDARPPQDAPPPDERTLKLGKSMPSLRPAPDHTATEQSANPSFYPALRILQTLLPTLLASPLPPEILSPQISLHLFPSTHPHLPTVSGKVAYHAALWTAPMAWGRVPIVGNVRLTILSERIVRNGSASTTTPERLIVRWQTCGKTRGKGMGALYRGIGASEQVDKITEWLGGDARDDEEYTGLFIFEFDEEGRIISHMIEHVEESGNWERTSRVVSVTDWLLGRMNGRKRGPELAWNCVGEHRGFQGARDRGWR